MDSFHVENTPICVDAEALTAKKISNTPEYFKHYAEMTLLLLFVFVLHDAEITIMQEWTRVM